MKTTVKSKWDILPPIRTTGIGSLPHHNADAALEHSFQMGIPFLPQIPIRNPWEFMIAQALEGLPGLQLEDEWVVTLNVDIWKSQSHLLDRRLKEAFSGKGSFEGFEPSVALSSCWQPFLWELQERHIRVAKVQIAGPMTCQWALRLKDGTFPDHYPELSTQIFQLVLARSLAFVHRIQACDIQPILYLDEPGLYAFSRSNPKHVLCLQELKLMIQTLKKAGAVVGLHCCSNTDWEMILGLELDILSLDTSLSLTSALKTPSGNAFENFITSGGRFSFGIIPTTRSSVLYTLDSHELLNRLKIQLNERWNTQPNFVQKILQEAIYTPACGLALQSTSEAELILDKLVETYEALPTH